MQSDEGEHTNSCPCCKACTDCTRGFQKVVDLQNIGLVIYRHTIQKDENAEDIDNVANASEDTYILHNTRNTDLTSADYLPEIDKTTLSCERCRQIIEHARRLLQKVPNINRNDIKSICDHCKLKEKSCYDCQETVKMFFASKGESKDNINVRVREWIARIKDMLKDAFLDETVTSKQRLRARSELQIDQLGRRVASRHKQDLGIEDSVTAQSHRPSRAETLPIGSGRYKKRTEFQLHDQEFGKPEQPLVFRDSSGKKSKLVIEKGGEIVFIKDDDSEDTRKAIFKTEKKGERNRVLSGVPPVPFQSQIDFEETKQVRVIDDNDTMAKQIGVASGKEPKTLKQLYKTDTKVSSNKWLSQSDFYGDDDNLLPDDYSKHYIHEKEKYLQLDQNLFKETDIESKEGSAVGDRKIADKLYEHRKERDKKLDRKIFYEKYASEKKLYQKPDFPYEERKIKQDRKIFDEHYEKDKEQKLQEDRTFIDEEVKDLQLRDKKLDMDSEVDDEVSSKFDKKYKDKTPTNIPLSSAFKKKYRSEEILVKVDKIVTDDLKKDFSFSFPHELKEVKKIKRQKSSSELIKDTQDMLNARAEEEKKRLEEERQKKAIEDEKKRLALEEKKKLAAEKKRIQEEKRAAKEEKKLMAEIERKLKEEQRLLLEQNKKQDKDVSEKEKPTPTPSTGTAKSKTKVPKPKPELKESKTKVAKVDKEALKAEKDAEKERKEKEKREKEEKLKKEKAEKEERLKREKLEKEERLKREKLEKEERLKKEKEDKERLKKQQAEQLQKEKEILQRQKDEMKREKQDAMKSDAKKETLAKEKDEVEDQKSKQDAAIKSKKTKETEDDKPPQENAKQQKKFEPPTTKELNIKKITMRKPSPDDLILQLVKLKQPGIHERLKGKRLSQIMTPVEINAHKKYHKYEKGPTCPMCTDSEMELEFEARLAKGEEFTDIIIGQKVLKYRPHHGDKMEDQGEVPLFFQSKYDEFPISKVKEVIEPIIEVKKAPGPPGKQTKTVTEHEVPKGVIRYALSDRTFIDKGWTLLPTEKVVRKMNVYRMRPAHPEFDWFEHNKNKRLLEYDTGERLAEFDDNGRGRWYYRNGRLALDYYDAEELNAQQRFVIYSSGEPDERGRSHPYTILATFDYLGNGIVFDHSGKIRLKYNQTEGVVLDRSIGPVSHWKWHTLNDPPVLQQVMIDTQMAHKDPDILKMGGPHDDKPRPDNEEMLAIEFDNFIKEKSKKLSQSFKPFQIKMKALKINEHFSLKVLDQATVYLIYRDGTTNLKLNIGMILDHKEIVDTDTAEIGEVSNNLERFPARTDSLAEMQRSVAYAQRFERTRTERERRLRPTEPCGSTDKLTAAASRPMRFPLRTVPTGSTTTATPDCCLCKYTRKPSSNNVYYDNRLLF